MYYDDDEEEKQMQMAVAMSMADARKMEDAILDEAVALSLDEAQWQEDTSARKKWSCGHCTFDNELNQGRCLICGSDRETPSVVPEDVSTVRKRKRCGLPGCANNMCRPDGFCSEDHARRASQRGLLAPATEDIERVFLGSSGDHSISLLTRAAPDRSAIAEHFLNAWRKMNSRPLGIYCKVTFWIAVPL